MAMATNKKIQNALIMVLFISLALSFSFSCMPTPDDGCLLASNRNFCRLNWRGAPCILNSESPNIDFRGF